MTWQPCCRTTLQKRNRTLRWLSAVFDRTRRLRGCRLSVILISLTVVGMTFPAAGQPLVRLKTQAATFAIDAKGSLCVLSRNDNGHSYLAPGRPAPLLSVRLDGKLHAPDSAAWDARTKRLTLHYGGANATVVLTMEAKPAYAVFEVVEVHPPDGIELVLWGPYPTTIGEIIGETVGVVRNPAFAVGIQALNVKTLGGYPNSADDAEGESSDDDQGNYPDLSPELLKGQHFRTDTARRTEFGSVLQAYCRNRNRARVVATWGHEKYEAPAFADGGVLGSKIALFGCPSVKALETIGAIEVAEGLPHPMIDGVWGKVSPGATDSYLIVDFSESNVDRAIEMARRAGLKYLYHSSPFATWGHFKLKPYLFPNGWDGLRGCVEKAHRAGVRIGLHTLSNHITPNDPFVTPIPDPRLARIGRSTLEADLDAAVKEIPIAAPDFFQRSTALNAVLIDQELIRYGSVSSETPWRMQDCERGALGTRAAPHRRGAAVSKLMDSDKLFVTDADLSQVVARNFARLCNHACILQTSLDGLEGNRSTGYGQYGAALFTKAWFDALAPELRGRVINDASRPGHFNWHIYTRMNWGEPWYAGFRESQTLYRFKNQPYFERNLMPRMLGWFALRPDSSIEDAEWLLARAAGFDAGFALATSLASTAQLVADPSSADTLERFGATPAILQAIEQWETARLAGAFPALVKAALRDNSREFHLQPAGNGQWDLYEVHPTRFVHNASQTSATEMRLQNSDAPQALRWIICSAAKEPVSGLAVEINSTSVVNLKDRSLPPGGSLRYMGGPEAAIADATGKTLAWVTVDTNANRIATGDQRVKVSGALPANASLKLELRTLSAATRIGMPRTSSQ